MGRGNCRRASRTLFACKPAALFTRTRAQSRAIGAFDFSGGRLFTGELVFSTGVACFVRQRLWHIASNDVDSAAMDHADLFVQFRRQLELALSRLCSTTRTARSATPTSFVHCRHRHSRRDLYPVLAPAHQSPVLAQRTQFRTVPESQPNRKSFWPDRDHNFGLRPGRSSQRTKTLACLGRRARPNNCRDHSEFFTRWNRHSRCWQRALAWRFLASPTFSIANCARRFIFAASTYCSASLRRANA